MNTPGRLQVMCILCADTSLGASGKIGQMSRGDYRFSPRGYTGVPDIDYPMHDKTIVVTRCDRICLGHKKINFSQVFASHAVGIKQVQDDIWLVSVMDCDLGYFDLETRVFEPLENRSAHKCYLCSRYVV
jgi:hypothetical protein